ncbi:single-stranded DNA-binding protein, partial [bacterium]|nr:single-stranded DNA-binding protein [bacterium]
MNDINTCTFTGNLTRDAELKYTNSGTAICNFSLAVNEKYGETDYASFFEFTIWGKFAEAVNQYLNKGLPVSVTAKAKQDRWEQDGNTRSKVKFTVLSLRMFGGKSGA